MSGGTGKVSSPTSRYFLAETVKFAGLLKHFIRRIVDNGPVKSYNTAIPEKSGARSLVVDLKIKPTGYRDNNKKKVLT